MNFFTRLISAVGFLTIAGGAVQAATFALDDAYRAPTSSFSITNDGITMTVSGGELYGGTSTVSTHAGYGLSVGYHLINGTVGCSRSYGCYTESREYARLSFSTEVTLDSFMASYVDYYDDYRVYANLSSGWTLVQSGDFGATNMEYGDRYDTGSVLVGGARAYEFAISVDDGWDEFKLTEVEVSAVPLPAGAVLLLSGLGLLGLRKRRKA